MNHPRRRLRIELYLAPVRAMEMPNPPDLFWKVKSFRINV
jgi:hypothetical protein